jgi:hypothetical protein
MRAAGLEIAPAGVAGNMVDIVWLSEGDRLTVMGVVISFGWLEAKGDSPEVLVTLGPGWVVSLGP